MPELKSTYSIGQVAAQFNLSIPTLRYYDQEGLIPNLHKNAAGARRFTAENLDTLKVIECLKLAGMPIKDIKQFMSWAAQGDSTLPQRLAMFAKLRETTQTKLAAMQQTMAFLDYKYDYYQQATQDGTERYVHARQPHLPSFTD